MKIAIVGAGALGAVYGARLALVGSHDVTFVVREARAKRGGPLRLQRVDGDEEAHELASPRYATKIPSDADVTIVTVRQDQLNDDLAKLIAPSRAPVVILTPMFADDFSRLTAKLGARIFPTMPSVVSYEKNGVIRYWLPRSATTQIESENAPPALADLAKALTASGIRAQAKTGVLPENVATMVSFMPIAFAIDAAGGVDALLENEELFQLAIDGVKEARGLAKMIGEPATWANLLLPFVNAFTLKAAVGLAKSRSPEAVFYVEEHFGRKLHAQNLTMARWMTNAASYYATDDDQLRALYNRLQAVR